MKSNNIPESLVEGLESRIKLQYSVDMFIKSGIFFLLAVISVLVLLFANIDADSSIYFLIVLLAVVGVIMGLVTLVFTKKEMRLVDTNQKIQCNTYYFDASHSVIMDAIRHHHFDNLKSMVNNTDSGIRLDLLSTSDASVARYRLYKYIPFEYQPISEIVEIDKQCVEAIRKL